jgi:propionate CoA-transferase
LEEEKPLEGARRIASRRAALELRDGAFVNVGYGVADGVPQVAHDEGLLDRLVFLIEQGAVGGIPTTGLNFGAMFNPAAIIDDGYQFDFFHGGGLDIAYLGFAEIDRHGNVNSSRFGNHLTGCGGFVDISQHAKKVVFCGAFAVKGDFEIQPGRLKINHPGKFPKFVNQVQQITFCGEYGLQKGQQVLYVTERAVFGLTSGGLELREIAPGVDLQRDILSLMDFAPVIPQQIPTMRSDIFGDAPLGLGG